MAKKRGKALILNKKQARVMARNIRGELLNSRLGKRRRIPHARDNKNYFLSNKFAELGIKPSRKIDRDQDGILDIEDCDPWDPRRQGILSSIKKAVSRVVSSVKKSKSSSSSSSGTVTKTSLPAKTQPSVRSVDVGTSTQARTGGYTVYGGESGVVGSSASSRSGSSGVSVRFTPSGPKSVSPSSKSRSQVIQQRRISTIRKIIKNVQPARKIELLKKINNQMKSRIPKKEKNKKVNEGELVNIKSFKGFKESINKKGAIKDLIIQPVKKIPTVIKDYGKSLGKGTIKVPLYVMDEAGYISQIRFNKNTKKLYVPKNVKYISQSPKMKKAKEWADYDFKKNPFKDPDYQNVGITTGLALLGITSPGTAAKAFGAIKGKAIWDAAKNPTAYNIAVVESLYLPGAFSKLKKAKGRGDILVADTGELVPLRERIQQVKVLTKNAGKDIEVVTAKPTKKAGVTNIKSPKNIDYTYGNKVEFGTSKTGKAYPTSEYFLKGKGTKVQKALKRGIVKIEKIESAEVNKKYGKKIEKELLKNGKMSEDFIKKYYEEAKKESNKKGKAVAVISPKRLRGFAQPEAELVKMLPKGYKQNKLKFAGWTEQGYRVYTDQPLSKNIKSFIKSKLGKGKIERSYFKKLSGEKLEYLRGRKAIKGEYAEHGKAHLTAENIDPLAKNYARKLNVKKFGNVFEQHDLAKVSDADSFSKFEHGEVLKKLWKKGDYPDKNIYKLPKKVQKQIMDAYAGHTPVKPRLLGTLKKGWKDNSVVKDLIWYAKNKRNPYLQDILTLDRIELPREGRWNIKVNYKLLDKKSLKRIYGSEENAVKNIKFLDWESVPNKLKNKLGKEKIKKIKSRDKTTLKNLKSKSKGLESKKTKTKKTYRRSYPKYKPKYKTIQGGIFGPSRRVLIKPRSSKYKPSKGKPYKPGYKPSKGKPYKPGYKSSKGKPYKPGYKSSKGKPYKPGYKPSKGKPYKPGYKPSKGKPYKPGYKPYSPVGKKSLKSGKKPGLKRSSRKGKLPKVPGSQVGYHVYGRSGKKLIRLSRKPMKKTDAENRGAYAIDHTTAKTFITKPAGKTKTFEKPKQFEKGYLKKTNKKFRAFRIKKGKVVKFKKERLIEKRKYGIDTPGEKRQLSLARFAKKKGFIGKKIVKKKSPTKKKYPKYKPKYKTIQGGIFGSSRRVLIKPKSSKKLTKKKTKVKKSPKKKIIKKKKTRRINRGIFG